MATWEKMTAKGVPSEQLAAWSSMLQGNNTPPVQMVDPVIGQTNTLQSDVPVTATEPDPIAQIRAMILNNPRAAKYQKELEQQMELQKQGISEAGALADRFEALPSKANLSPLLALSDTWFGGNLQKGYQKPLTDEEKISGLSALRKVPQDERQKLMDNLSRFISGGDEKALLSLKLAEIKNQGTQGRSEEASIDKYRKNLSDSPAFKNYQEVYSAHEAVKTLLDNPTAYGDLGAMFTFMKSLDPDSVVREGEQMLFRKTGSLSDKASNALNRFVSGQTLTPEQRQSVIDSANKLVNVRRQTYENFKKPTLEQAKRRGFKESEIDPSSGFSAAEKKAPSAMSQQDKQALDWANANPNDPRAAAIKQKLGM